jgi:GR25 family glycosyltransferase involved in LPS biosynthesis
MINTYVVHYAKLKERRKYLEPILKNFTLITATDKDSLSIETVDKFYDKNIECWNSRCENIYRTKPTYRQLGLGEISCCINHLKAWEQFLYDPYFLGLFLEDDIILFDNFYEKLTSVIVDAPEFDIMFVGGGFHHSIAPTISSITKDTYSYIYKGHPSTNCVCSYLLTKNLAKKIVEFYFKNKFSLPIDYEINYMLKKLNCKILHIEPSLCVEGSSTGAYVSSQLR